MIETTRRCCRIGDHQPHQWKGSQFYWSVSDKWVREVYWCKGHVKVEGGHRGIH